MRATWRWMLAVAAVLALGAVVLAVDEATRDDDGDTAYQGLTTGEGNPIQVTADAYGRLWVNIASGTAGVQTEDAAHTSADKGVMTLAVTKATRAALAADGDYTPLQLTTNGDLRTRDDDLNTATGTATTAAVDGDAAGSAVAHLRGINKKLAGNVAVTEGSGATIATNTGALAGSATTFQVPVKIDQAAAGRTTILALEADKVIYLHALVGTMDVAGTVTIAYDDDGAGTNEVTLTGNMPVAATGGMVIPFNANTNGCLRTAAGKQLTIVTTGGAFDGYAIVSKAAP